MYRESAESQKKLAELCMQSGVQRRNREMLSWLKKRKRGVIRQEELIAFICGKSAAKERHDRHHASARSPRRVPESLSGATASLFSTAITGQADHRLHSRSPPQTFARLSLSDSAASTAAASTVDAEAADLQPFREALALSSHASGALGARKSRVFAHFNAPDAVDLQELNAFMSEEFTRNVDSKKRPSPMNDVVMSSPTHKKPKFL